MIVRNDGFHELALPDPERAFAGGVTSGHPPRRPRVQYNQEKGEVLELRGKEGVVPRDLLEVVAFALVASASFLFLAWQAARCRRAGCVNRAGRWLGVLVFGWIAALVACLVWGRLTGAGPFAPGVFRTPLERWLTWLLAASVLVAAGSYLRAVARCGE